MSVYPTYTGSYRTEVKSLRPADASNPLQVFKAGALGSRVHAVNIAGNDTSARDLQLYYGKKMTLQSAMGTTSWTSGTITRSSGSFLTDGWAVGDTVIPIGSTTRANDKLLTVTAVVAGTLTFSETQSAESFASGGVLYRGARLTTHNVPITAGYLNSTPSVDGLRDNCGVIDASPNRYLTMGPDDILAAVMGATITSAKQIDVATFAGDY